MNALLFSDLHSSKKALKKIFDLVKDTKYKIGALLFAGDFVDMGEPLEFQREFIHHHTQNPIPLFWVPGNNDFGRSYKLMQNYLPSVEGRVEKFNGFNITGVGGSPASWAGEYPGEKNIIRDELKDSIFISHQPPPGLFDLKKTDYSPIGEIPNDKSQMTNESSNIKSEYTPSTKSELRATNSPQRFNDAPKVHICGHIHNQWGIGYVGQTKVVKLAASYLGFVAIMNLETLKVEFIEL